MTMEKVLEVKDLRISFDTFAGKVNAIRGVSFDLYKGETLAIVGESGSGKSVTTRSIMRLLSSNANIDNGEILFKGQDIVHKTEKQMQAIRGKEIAMIFQDPMTSLDPTMPIGKQVAESLIKHNKVSKKEGLAQALELLKLVGIPNAEKRLKNYPHQFSGGQRQRIVIAIALICYPEVLIADEPTTALDVTIQAQILELLKDLQEKISTSIIFITHDLGGVANVADRVAVMYGGRLVEVGTAEEIFYNPQHPYTKGLLSCIANPEDLEKKELHPIPGSPPDLLNISEGCPFLDRCENAMNICVDHMDEYRNFSSTHCSSCWLNNPYLKRKGE